MKPMPVVLAKSKSLYFEDNFAKLPELRMVFPTVEEYHKDKYALQVLGQLLSGSKKSPLYNIMVEEKKLAPNAYSFQRSNELAGEFAFIVRANTGVDLDSVKVAINEGLERFEKDGFTDNELKRIKAEQETQLYQGFSTVLNKAFQLVQDNEFKGDPGYISETARLTNQVTREDIIRVYNQYLKEKNYIMTSVVPKGQLSLAANDASEAKVWIEEVKNNVANEEVGQGEEAVYEKTPSKYDRSEPELRALPLFKSPEVWISQATNGMKLYGIENDELPLASFDITIPGGHLLDPINKSGITSLMTDLMMQGTANKTAAELEEAIGLLGASINIYSTSEEIRITGSCLSKNFEKTLALVEEIILHPRWDQNEFDRLKQALETNLKGREANPRAIASMNFQNLIYGDHHIFGIPSSGTLESVQNISLSDIKNHYKLLGAKKATFHIAGSIKKEQVEKALVSIASSWNTDSMAIPEYPTPENEVSNKLYFIDVPNAKQSVIYIGNLALSANDPDFNKLIYANEILGGGSSGKLFQTLRIEKGYTYGAYSRINRQNNVSPFVISTSVRANATLASLKIIEDMVSDYGKNFGKEDAETTKTKILKGSTRDFEGLGDKLRILREMSKYGKPASFVENSQKELVAMNAVDFKNIIAKHIQEDKMIYVVVGDKATQFDELKKFNKPVVELDIHGNKI